MSASSTQTANNSAAAYFDSVRRNLEWIEDVRHLLDSLYDLETGLAVREELGKRVGCELIGEAYRTVATDFIEFSLRIGHLVRPANKSCLIVYEELQQNDLYFLAFSIGQKEVEGALIFDEFAANLTAASSTLVTNHRLKLQGGAQ